MTLNRREYKKRFNAIMICGLLHHRRIRNLLCQKSQHQKRITRMNPNNKEDGMREEGNYSDLKDYYSFGKELILLSYQMEEKRGNGIQQLSVQLLTCVTILSVAYLSPAPAVFGYFGCYSFGLLNMQSILAWMYCVVFILLVVAFLLILISQMLRKTKTLASPAEQKDYCIQRIGEIARINKKDDNSSNKQKSCTQNEILEAWANALNAHYKGMEKKYDRMAILLKIAMILIASSCILALLFAFFLVAIM